MAAAGKGGRDLLSVGDLLSVCVVGPLFLPLFLALFRETSPFLRSRLTTKRACMDASRSFLRRLGRTPTRRNPTQPPPGTSLRGCACMCAPPYSVLQLIARDSRRGWLALVWPRPLLLPLPPPQVSSDTGVACPLWEGGRSGRGSQKNPVAFPGFWQATSKLD